MYERPWPNAYSGVGSRCETLVGPPSGVYDHATFDAMSAFQVRKGYKPVGVPTAYSLRDLGVRKNSGYAATSPARVVEATSP